MSKKGILYPLRRLHGSIYEYYHGKDVFKKTYLNELKEKMKKNPNAVFLVLTPEHGNLGDHAIALAEINMLKSMEIDYIEISGKKLNEMKKYKFLSIMNGRNIFLQGGGYLGTIWFTSELLLRELIKKSPHSMICLMPNTIYYEDSLFGKKELKKSIKCYNRHKNLYLYAREEISYEIMKKIYKNVKLIPDVVLSLNKCSEQTQRNGCLLCLRNDIEKTRTKEEENLIKKQVMELFKNNIQYTDMVLERNVSSLEREAILEEKFAQFRSAELVITDRLHGMIFAAITGTPCIVINSMSPKVRGCYEWIKDLEYINFVDSISQIEEVYKLMPKGNHSYDNSKLQHYYKELKEDIMKLL